MRALVLVLIVAIIVVIAALMSGFVHITGFRGEPPELVATRNSVTLKGGQPPAFDVESGSVKVGTRPANIQVPAVTIRKPADNRTAAATNNVM